MTSKNTLASPSNNYRSDIDGLRAVAVLSVILFHINKEILPGGFVGVDIFFVISGYLISLHIFKDIEAGKFSIVEFYRRRIKRIAPALLLVLACTLFLSQLLFLPLDAEKVAESSIWALASLANVYFWLFQDTSYFSAASNELPLLHLWSLGVEEQFYVFWPLILMLVYRGIHKGLFAICTIIIAALSFWLGEKYFTSDPSFVYYMLPTRAGELFVGALVALITIAKIPIQLPNYMKQILATIGVALLVVSFTMLDEEGVFPGFQAIPPTIGAGLLIFVGNYGRNWVTPLLITKPMLWVGLVSYSAYLWHWPILSFFRYGQFEITLLSGSCIFILTMMLAWFTYKFVEQPMRKTKGDALQVFIKQYFIPAGVLGFIALVAMKLDGYGLRWFDKSYKNDLVSAQTRLKPSYDFNNVCMKQRLLHKDIERPDCLIGKQEATNQKILLWGDSNAAHYIGLISVFAEMQGFQFRNMQVGSCPPLINNIEAHVNPKRIEDCIASQQLIWPQFEKYDVIFIAASWSVYIDRSDTFIAALQQTLTAITDQDKNVILIGKAPEFEGVNRFCETKSLSFPFMDCKIEENEINENIFTANTVLKDIAAISQNVEYTDFNQYLCPKGLCSAFLGAGESIYFDSSHLSHFGSQSLGKMIVRKYGVPKIFTAEKLSYMP